MRQRKTIRDKWKPLEGKTGMGMESEECRKATAWLSERNIYAAAIEYFEQHNVRGQPKKAKGPVARQQCARPPLIHTPSHIPSHIPPQSR